MDNIDAKLSTTKRSEYRRKMLEYKEKHNLSQRKFAKLLKISPATMNRLCNDPDYLPTGDTIENYRQVVRDSNSKLKNTLNNHLYTYFKQKPASVIDAADLAIIANALTEILDESRIATAQINPDACLAYYRFVRYLFTYMSDLCTQKQQQIDKLTTIKFSDEQIEELKNLIYEENEQNELRRKQAGL